MYIPALPEAFLMRFARFFAAVLLAATPALATTVLRLTPDEVDGLAHRIVEGRVVAAHDVQVTGTEATAVEYELAVDRILKDDGSVTDAMARRNGILLIRQLGSLDGLGASTGIPGMPRYVVGERYRLALNGDSSKGLTSPVGMGQGVQRLPETPAPAKGTP